MSNKIKLVASMIVKNEHELLSECLESIKDLDDIYIVDTGSTDDTVEIARKYSDKVYEGEYTWNDDFAEARNYCLNKIPDGYWVLIIDADEVLCKDGVKKIRNAIENAEKNGLRSISPKITTHFEKDDGSVGFTGFFNVRVFRKEKNIRWTGAVHNLLLVESGNNKEDITITARISPAHKEDPDRALRILEKTISSQTYTTRELYFLAREYFTRRRYGDAVSWFDEYLKFPPANLPEYADAYFIRGLSLWSMKRFTEGHRSVGMAVVINPNFKEAIKTLAVMSNDKSRARWEEFALNATNEDVLIVREALVPHGTKADVKKEDFVKHDNNSQKRKPEST